MTYVETSTGLDVGECISNVSPTVELSGMPEPSSAVKSNGIKNSAEAILSVERQRLTDSDCEFVWALVSLALAGEATDNDPPAIARAIQKLVCLRKV
jgi:hypothetical protein